MSDRQMCRTCFCLGYDLVPVNGEWSCMEHLNGRDAAAEIVRLNERLAEAEAARDIADQQLTVICEGVNRRCGADNHQLPIVSLDRLLAAHARDRINLVAWVRRNLDDDVCLTGECIHGMNSDCIESIIERYIAAATAAGGCDGTKRNRN